MSPSRSTLAPDFAETNETGGGRLTWYQRELRNLGLRNWFRLRFAARKARRLAYGDLVPVPAPGLQLYWRAHTSDPMVFSQIFVSREYRCLDHVQDPRLIIDCGANVGYSSAYFLNRFPGARVIAVEPDPGNFEAAQRNLAPFANRTELIKAGVWSKSVGLVMGNEKSLDGNEWSFTVREAADGEPATVAAVDVGSILSDSGFDRISILKIDIEGSEVEVFKDSPWWLDKVDHLVIELHGPDCEAAVMAAVNGRAIPRKCDELTVFDFVH